MIKKFLLLLLFIIVVSCNIKGNEIGGYYRGNKEYNENIYIINEVAFYFVNECDYYLPVVMKITDNRNVIIGEIISPAKLPDPDEKVKDLKIIKNSDNSISIENSIGCDSGKKIFRKGRIRMATVAATSLRVRKFPTIQSDVIGTLKKGDKVVVLGAIKKDQVEGKSGEWLFVIYKNGSWGNCFSQFLVEDRN